jgi:hypothetical protein
MSRSLLMIAALTLACVGRGAATPMSDDPWPRVVEQASRDFGCPAERIRPSPCACMGVTALSACGIEATYGFARRADGDYDVHLVMAWLPPRR